MKKIGPWVPRAFFESFLIVMSILLALAVNEWRDNRLKVTRLAETRAAFANEIRANRDLLLSDAFLAHHRRLLQEYQALMSAGSTEEGGMFRTGAHPAPLRDAAWRSFSNGGPLADFAPKDVVLLSDIYRAQEDLAQLNSSYISSMRTPRADRETPAFLVDTNRSIAMYLSDVVSFEERLLQIYQQALPQLEAK